MISSAFRVYYDWFVLFSVALGLYMFGGNNCFGLYALSRYYIKDDIDFDFDFDFEWPGSSFYFKFYQITIYLFVYLPT